MDLSLPFPVLIIVGFAQFKSFAIATRAAQTRPQKTVGFYGQTGALLVVVAGVLQVCGWPQAALIGLVIGAALQSLLLVV